MRGSRMRAGRLEGREGRKRVRSFGYMMIALCAGAATVSADLIRYKLNDHPDGTAQPPGYGLRLDELVDITPRAKDIFTFSFNLKGLPIIRYINFKCHYKYLVRM